MRIFRELFTANPDRSREEKKMILVQFDWSWKVYRRGGLSIFNYSRCSVKSKFSIGVLARFPVIAAR